MELMQASHEWATRPNDQRFLTLDELHAAVSQRREESWTATPAVSDLRTVPLSDGGLDQEDESKAEIQSKRSGWLLKKCPAGHHPRRAIHSHHTAENRVTQIPSYSPLRNSAMPLPVYGKGRITSMQMTEEALEVLNLMSHERERSRSYLMEMLLWSHPEFQEMAQRHGIEQKTRRRPGGDMRTKDPPTS